jgi:AAA family ATP:ADP antiporter
LLNTHRGEGPAVFWSFCYFFSLLGSYYILRPIRDTMGIEAGIDRMHWLFTGTFVTMLLLVPAFGWITSRFGRQRFLPYVYTFFIANILLFYLLFESGLAQAPVAAAFFVWLSVFNLFVVSVFWSFMTDLFHDDQAKRLFGFIAAGGTLGAIAGPATTAILVLRLGNGQLLLISAALLGFSILCITRLISWKKTAPQTTAAPAGSSDNEERPLSGGALDGILLVMRSPYLLGICVLILLYSSLSTFLYFQQAQIIEQAFDGPDARTAVFAAIDLAVNILTLLIQTLITAPLVRRLGLAVTLALIPLFLSLGFLALALIPALHVLATVQVIRRAGNYAIMRPAREMLYVVLRREEKYKAKNFIDTVVYRGGDAASSWIYTAMRNLGLGLSATAWVAVPLSLLWAWVAFRLGRRHDVMARPHGQNSQGGAK